MGIPLTDKEKGRLDDQLFEVRRLAAQGELSLGFVRSALQDIIENPLAKAKSKNVDSGDPSQNRNILITDVSEQLGGVRAVHALLRASLRLRTLGDVADSTESEVKSIAQVGDVTVAQWGAVLESYGLKFSTEADRKAPPQWWVWRSWRTVRLRSLGLSPGLIAAIAALRDGTIRGVSNLDWETESWYAEHLPEELFQEMKSKLAEQGLYLRSE